MRNRESRPNREIHSITDLSQEIRKISNKQSNFIPERVQQTKPKVSRRMEIIKIRVK